MDDLIGLTMDGSSVKTQGKPTNFLIDYDFDGIDASSSSVAPGIPSLPAASSTPGTTASPQNIVNAKDAAYGWDMCLKESLDMVKFPRGPVFDGPFKEFEQVWKDKQNNTHNIINPFLRPTGPTHEHIIFLQGLNDQGQPLDHIAHLLVVTYPDLMRGWKDGTEHDRRLQIHGLVNLWTSMWAPKFAPDGTVLEVEGDRADSKETPKAKLNVPDWLKK